MKKQNSLFAFALLFSLWGLGQTAMAQKARKEVSRAQAKTLMLKQQKATPSDLKRFRDEPIPGGMARIILEAHDVWGDGSGYQMLLDADHTAYGNEIPLTTPLGNTLTVDCDIPATLYAPFEFKVPADADPSCTPEHQVVDGVACIDLPAGVYDYVVVNPTPSLCIVIPGIFGQEDDTFGDDFRFEAGKIYHFLVAFHDGGTFSTTGDYVTLTVTDGTPLHPVQNLKGTAEGQKVTLKWDSPTSGKSTIVLNESFDKENLPDGWSMIDADGDGHNWMSTIGVHNTLPHSGAGAMFSKSWTSRPDLTPDNYLVTPRFTVPVRGKLTYWVSTQEEWVNENYGVFLSISGNQATDFTEKLFEENLSNGKPVAIRQKSDETPKLPAPYRKRSIDLSAYAGQEVYLAFRHFNSEGVFRFYLDDVTVSEGEVSEEFTYTVYRDGTKIKEGLTATLFEENGVSVGTHEYCVEVQYAGGVSPKECVDITVISQSLSPVTGLTATQDGIDVILQWEAPILKESSAILNENFETITPGEIPDGWSVIDVDGDNRNWEVFEEYGYNDSKGIGSRSWLLGFGALTPDNYLITPNMNLVEGGTLTFRIRALGFGIYGHEHYAVYASSGGNSASDFTHVLLEETTSSKSASFDKRIGKIKGAWWEKTIALPANTKYVAFRHFNCTDQSRLILDEIKITGVSASEYSYTIYRDGNKIKEGLQETTYKDIEVPAGKHTYCIEVQYAGGVSPKECVDITVSSQSLNPVTGLMATQDGMDAVLRWGAPVAKDEVVLLSESFDTGKMPEGWTTIDSDGDGHAWDPAFLFDFGGQGHNGSIGLISSASYIYYVGILTPDNYLISPELSLINGGTLSFWVCAQDIGHPAEHYAVYASTGGNAVEDFTILLLEETIENKTVQSMRKSSELRSQTPWKEKTVTLPVGTKYVAFRHFDCSDMYRLCIDDVEVSCKEDEIPYTYTIYRNGTEIASAVTETTYRDMNLVPGTYTYGVKVVYPNGESSVEEATLTITSLSETVTTRPYTLAIHDNQITVTCKGEVRIYDMYGRSVVSGADVVEYTAQNGAYVIRISVNGKTYIEKVSLK